MPAAPGMKHTYPAYKIVLGLECLWQPSVLPYPEILPILGRPRRKPRDGVEQPVLPISLPGGHTQNKALFVSWRTVAVQCSAGCPC